MTTKRTPVKDMPAPSTTSRSAVDTLSDAFAGVTMLAIDSIDPHPANPRKNLGDLTELADSIREHGIKQPLTVVPAVDGRYTAVIGHRRLAAAGLAGLTRVPAIIEPAADAATQLEWMLVENLQRVDLTPFEEGHGYQGLLDLGLTQTKIAQRTGRAPRTVKNRVALGSLDPRIEEKVTGKELTLEQAITLGDIQLEAPEIYASLIEQLDRGHLDQWAINNATRVLERQKQHQTVVDQAKADNVTVTTERPYVGGECVELSRLKIKPAKHTGCAGHAVYIDQYDPKLLYVCTNAPKHHPDEVAETRKAIGMTPTKTETPEQKAAREALDTLVAELRQAATTRASWLVTALRDDSTLTARLRLIDVAAAIVASEDAGGDGEWLLPDVEKGTELPTGAALLALAIIYGRDNVVPTGAFDITSHQDVERIAKDTWVKDWTRWCVEYLNALAGAGYPLTDAETHIRDAFTTALAAAADLKKAVKS